MDEITVVVVGFHPDAELLTGCLESIRVAERHAGVGVEVIVVDNGGVPAELVERYGARLVPSPGNVGFAVAANHGVGLVRSRFSLLLNPDAALAPTTLQQLLSAHRNGAGDLLAGWLISHQRIQVDGLFSWWFSTERLLRRRREAARLARAAGSGDPVEVSKVSGGALFAETQLLGQLGPFDESFFLYGEDVDLSLRARRAGFRLAAVPGAVVSHEGAASSDGHGAIVERARVDAALRLFSRHRGRVAGLLARLELLLITAVGLLSDRTSSGTRASRTVRFAEIRRWGLRREAPRFSPSFVTGEGVTPGRTLLVIAPVLQGGGAQRALEAVLRAAPDGVSTHTVALFAGCRNIERVRQLSGRFEMWNLSQSPIGILTAALRLRSRLRDADAVLSLTRGSNCVLGLLPGHRKPTLLAQHMLPSLEGEGARHAIEDLAYRRAIRRADAVVVPSTLAGDEMALRFTAVPAKCHVVPNPFEPDSRPLVGVRQRPLDVLRLAFIGRLEEDKGLDLLIPVLREALDRPAELRVAGDGPQASYIRRESDDQSGDLRVTPLGWCDDVTALIDWCDAVVLPSRAELTPYTVNEAWSRGRPVLASAIPPLRALAQIGPLVPMEMLSEAWGAGLRTLAESEPAATAAFASGPQTATRTDTGTAYLELLGMA